MAQALTTEDVLYVQRCCAVSGLYAGPLSGVWSAATDRAEQAMAAKAEALKAEIGGFDPRSERCIAGLIPPAQKVARAFLVAARGFRLSVRIVSGTRSYAEQDALYAIGRTVRPGQAPVTKARGGQSNHNFGIAWDVGLFANDGSYLTGQSAGEIAAYVDLAAHVKASVPEIEWGGDWHDFKDRPHFQLATGKSVTAIRAAFEAGKPLVG